MVKSWLTVQWILIPPDKSLQIWLTSQKLVKMCGYMRERPTNKLWTLSQLLVSVYNVAF